MTELKEEIDDSTVIVDYFCTSLSVIEQLIYQLIKYQLIEQFKHHLEKKIEQNIIRQLAVADTYRKFYSTTVEFFSSVFGTFYRTDLKKSLKINPNHTKNLPKLE